MYQIRFILQKLKLKEAKIIPYLTQTCQSRKEKIIHLVPADKHVDIAISW